MPSTHAIARRMLLKRIYNKMTDEEKQMFVLFSMQNKSNEILQAIQQNQQHLERLVRHVDQDQWYKSFGADVAANVLTTSAFWLISKFFANK